MFRKIALIGSCLALPVQFLFAQTTYYSKSTGNLNTLGTWGTVSDGSGTAPTSFTVAGCTYNIVNNTSPTISANWTVSGAGSVVNVGNGTQAVNFSIPARVVSATMNILSSSTVTTISTSTITASNISVSNNAFLTILSAANPTLGTLSAGSTVTYSRAGAQPVANAAYSNLTLGGSGTKTLANTTNTSVNNVLTIGSGFAFQLSTTNTLSLTLNGTLTGSGTMTGGTNSNLVINGTGTFGTIIPTSSPLTLRTLVLNRTSSGSVTLGGNVTVGTTGTFSNGTLNLNGHTLTLNGTLTLPVSASNGGFTGSSAASMSIGASSITNSLFFTSGAQTLGNFTFNNSSATLALGTDLTVATAYAHTRGIMNLNGKTLTLSGTVAFPTNVANGTTTGSSSSSLIINGTTISNTFNMTTGGQALNNFTLNSTSTQTLTIGNDITVSGAFNHNNGIFRLNGHVLTLNGTATFPVASTNGTMTGTTASDLIINATAVSNTLFFTTGALTLRNLTLNCGSQTVKLGTSLTVSGAFTQTSGILNLNGQTLTTSGTITFPSVSTSGSISGSTSSTFSITATSITNSLFMTSGAQALNNLTLNSSGQTLRLGSDLTVSGTYIQTKGIVNINGNTLSLAGTATFASTIANGTTTGSTTSSLLISATTITNTLNLTAGGQSLNNFTLNSSGQTLIMGNDIAVSGAFNQTNGILRLNGHVLTLNGTATFPVASTNGTITGTAVSDLIINATAVSNTLFFTASPTTLRNFTLNCASQTVKLGSGLTVSGAFTQTNGILNLNGQTLTLSGTATFPIASTNGTISGSNTSNLSISATSIANTIFFTTGAQALRNFTLNSAGQTLNLGSALTIATTFAHTNGIINLNGQTLTINGAATFPAAIGNGSFSGSTASSLSIGGSGTVTNSLLMTQSGTANYMNNVTLNRSGQTLTLGNALNLYGTLTPTAGTFASAGNLTLVASSYSITARIGTIGASGSVTGNVTSQVYAKGGSTGWTTMGAPGISGRTFSDWNDDFAITCLNCPDGYNVGGSNFGSILWYDETVGGLHDNATRYKEIQNITDAMTVGKGWWVYLGNSTTTTSDIVIDVTGPVNQGSFPITLTETSSGGGTDATDHGYNLISNPYPSPISWSSLLAGNTNVADAIYVYNPDISGYASYVAGVSSPAMGSGGVGNYIPIGQAFYVKANAASVTLTAAETYKGASSQELLRMSGQQHQSTTNPMVMRLLVNGHAMQYETALYFDPNATTNFETAYDAKYLGVDPGALGMATSMGGIDYAINGLPALNQNFSIPVKVTTGSTDTYQISGDELYNLPSGACIFLHDNYTNTDHNLRSGPYTCTITDTENVARFVLNLNINNSLTVSSIVNNPICSSTPNGSIVASSSGSGPWNYYWKDANNNIIKTSLNKTTSDTLTGVVAGNYLVDVNTNGICDNGTQTFTLLGATQANAAFNPSATNVLLVSDTVSVVFANNSTNASNYWWNFGDGNGSADSNPTNYYASPGDYSVTLTAYNSVCGDSSVTTQVITVVDGTTANGIAAYAEPTRNMFISRDERGYYVQFSYKERTNAVITVQNILGEKVSADLPEKNVTSDKVYIPLGNTGSNILILSVVTEAGEKTFCKVVNY